MTKPFASALKETGIFEYGVVETRDIEFSEEVRKYCEKNICRKYGATYACPPAIGTVSECRARALGYEKMLVFSVKFDLKHSFDYRGMLRGMKEFKLVAAKVDDALRKILPSCLILGNEGCGVCEKCAYPHEPCRFPQKVHGSIEGYGIFVSDLAKQARVRYNNGDNTVTYFGAVLYNESAAETND